MNNFQVDIHAVSATIEYTDKDVEIDKGGPHTACRIRCEGGSVVIFLPYLGRLEQK